MDTEQKKEAIGTISKAYKKAQLYVYVESDLPSKTDGWKKTNIELTMEEKVQKLSWRTSDDSASEVGGWGSNNIVVTKSSLDKLTGQILTLCDAMIADKDQKDAWKNLLRSTIHKWHDEKMYYYNLEEKINRDKVQ